MIRVSGAGSGLDIEPIITKLLTIEREPLDLLQDKRDRLDVNLSAFGKARTAISQLSDTLDVMRDPDKFGSLISVSSDESVLTASASLSASANTHDIEVLSLATAQQLSSDPYASSSAEAGDGDYDFSSGSNSFRITIDGSNNTVAGLRDAINAASDNTSVDASIINVDDGTRLMLTAREPGIANEIDVTRTYQSGGFFGGTSTSQPFTETRAANDARLRIDGLTITRSSNTVSDAIAGVTMTLNGEGTATLDTRRNEESMRETLDEFIKRYNSLRKTLSDLGEDELQGDRLTRNVGIRLNQAFNERIELDGGDSIAPVELGFMFDKEGVLSIDKTELDNILAEDFERYAQGIYREDTGLAQRLSSVLDEFVRGGGVIDGRELGIDRRRDSLDTQIDRFDYRLEKIEERYRRQFSNLDQLMSQLSSTSDYLATRLLSNSQSGG